MLNVFASVVTDHHFVSHHKRLHEALAADRAPLPVGAVGPLAVVLGYQWLAEVRGRCAELARCAVFNEVCEQRQGRVDFSILIQ